MPRLKQNQEQLICAIVRANIKYELDLKGWKKNRLIELTHISQPTLYRKLRNNTEAFKLSELVVIADKLGVTVDKLLTKKE